MKQLTFQSELIEGHKGAMAVIVPFNPEEAWKAKPVRLDARRDGWLVQGTANGVSFVGYIGNRWGRFFILLDPATLEAAALKPGDGVTVSIAPTATAKALAKAREQSQITTAPKKGRADSIDPEPKPKRAAKKSRK